MTNPAEQFQTAIDEIFEREELTAEGELWEALRVFDREAHIAAKNDHEPQETICLTTRSGTHNVEWHTIDSAIGWRILLIHSEDESGSSRRFTYAPITGRIVAREPGSAPTHGEDAMNAATKHLRKLRGLIGVCQLSFEKQPRVE